LRLPRSVELRGQKQAILIAVDLGGRAILLEAVGSPQDYQRAFAPLKARVEVIRFAQDQ